MKVTALIITFNHKPYIAQAIESALAQDVDFGYEILISEDCSTDGTRDIVRSYAGRFPDRIRLLLSDTNIRSNEVVARGFRAARGQYIALLDGDDYWTSPDKLRLQAHFLDEHPSCSMCFHNALVVSEGTTLRTWTPPGQKILSALEDMWMGNFIATCSVMYRRGLIGEIPAWYASFFPITDWPLHLLHAACGPIGYLDQVMGAYRHHPGGFYSVLSETAKQDETARFYEKMNRLTGFRYDRMVKKAYFQYFADWSDEYARRGRLEAARDCLNRSVRGGGRESIRQLKRVVGLGYRLYLRPGIVTHDSSARTGSTERARI